MINVQGIRRNMKNVVKNYTEAQVKVREATSNDPWGPSSTLMSEIADLTYNVVAFSEIMQMVWKRLNDHGKNWRHVYKALVLLEYLIKTGSEKVAQQCRENIFAIQTLKDFQYIEENKDQGMNVREKSKMLVGLLKDEEKLKVERSRALKAKERFAQSMSYMGTSVSGEEGATAGSLPRTSTSYHESLSSSSEHYAFGASSRLSSDLETARPQTVGEEELQLQLALAMSKEEAEQEDKQRKNDEIRLKMAINQSEGNASDSTSKKVPVNHHKQPTSAMDDLLSLNVTNNASSVPTDPWGVPFNNGNDAHRRDAFGGVLAHSAPSNNIAIKQQKDPWGSQTTPPMSYSAAVSGSAGVISSSVSDPWTNPVQSKVNNDPWQPSPHTTPDNSDPWSPTNNEGNRINNTSLSPSMDFLSSSGNLSPTNMLGLNSSNRKTPENFLGANSNLVNLDALVSKPPPVVLAPTAAGNPFAPASTASLSNPFQASKPPAPTINQLRAQNQFPTMHSTAFEPNNQTANSNMNSNANPLQPTLFNSVQSALSTSPSTQQQTQNPFSM